MREVTGDSGNPELVSGRLRPLWTRSPLFLPAVWIVTVGPVAAATMSLSSAAGAAVVGGGVVSPIVSLWQERALLRLNRRRRRLAYLVQATGEASHDAEVNRIVLDRMNRAIQVKPASPAALRSCLVVLAGVCCAAGVLRSWWWLPGAVPALTLLAVVLVRRPRPSTLAARIERLSHEPLRTN